MMSSKLLFLLLLVCSFCAQAAPDLAENPIASEEIVVADASEPATLASRTQDVLMRALSLTGIDYKYGGNSPETGFDCSGFVRYVFSQAANLTLPPTARAISQTGKFVEKSELQPGDLVFFNTLKTAFSHVGIYLGNNRFIHAPRTGGQVRIESMDNSYWLSRFNGAKRVEVKEESAN